MKNKKRFYGIITIVLFLLGALSFWEMLCDICNMAGAIACADPGYALKELTRMLPFMLTACTYIHLGLRAGRLYSIRNNSEKVFRLVCRTGYSVIVPGAVIVLYILVGTAVGKYESLIEGFISPLFPLDILFGGMLFIAGGILILHYASNIGSFIAGIPFRAPSDGRNSDFNAGRSKSFISSVTGVFGRIGCIYAYLAALSGFTACLYGTYSMDWSHGAIIFNIVLWLNYFSAFTMACVYRFGYSDLAPSERPAFAKRFGLGFLIGNVLLLAAHIVTVFIWNEAPNQNAYAILPIDYFSSINAFLILYSINNLLIPLFMFIFGRCRSRRISTGAEAVK